LIQKQEKEKQGLGTAVNKRRGAQKRKRERRKSPDFFILHFLSLEKKEPVLRKKKNIYFYAVSSTLKVR